MAGKYTSNADEQQQQGMQNVFSLWNALSGRLQQQQQSQQELQAKQAQAQLEMAHQDAMQKNHLQGQLTNEKAIAEYKDHLAQEGGQRNLATLGEVKNKYPDATVSIGENGNVSVSKPTPDGMSKFLQTQQYKDKQADNKRAQHAGDLYNKESAKYTEQIKNHEALMEDLNNPNSISGGIAKSKILNALGYNRYNDNEANAIYGGSVQQVFGKLINAMGGSEGTLSPAQMNDTKAVIMQMHNALKNQHAATVQRAIDTYNVDGQGNPETIKRLQDNLGKGFNEANEKFEKSYAPKPQAKQFASDEEELAWRRQRAAQNKQVNPVAPKPVSLKDLFGTSSQMPQE